MADLTGSATNPANIVMPDINEDGSTPASPSEMNSRYQQLLNNDARLVSDVSAVRTGGLDPETITTAMLQDAIVTLAKLDWRIRTGFEVSIQAPDPAVTVPTVTEYTLSTLTVDIPAGYALEFLAARTNSGTVDLRAFIRNDADSIGYEANRWNTDQDYNDVDYPLSTSTGEKTIRFGFRNIGGSSQVLSVGAGAWFRLALKPIA